jgi:hypothetical protein
MTELFVNPEGMTALYNQLHRLDIDAATTLDHVNRWCDLRFYGEGIIFKYFGPHDQAYGDVTGKLETAAFLASGLRSRVNLAQNIYARIDAQAARNLDGAYPGAGPMTGAGTVSVERPDVRSPHVRFADVREPTSRLHTPEWISGSTTYQLDVLTGLLSPSAWIRAACQEALHFDPFEPWLKAVTGDWSDYHACSVVWGQVAAASSDMSDNVMRVAQDLPSVWRGNAADGLGSFLSAFSAALGDLSRECSFYAARYGEAAQAAQEFFAAVSKPVGDLLDAVIYAAIAAAVGTASVETVVGGIIGYGVAAFYVARAIEIYYVVQGAFDAFEAWVSLSAGTLDAYHSDRSWSMPQLSNVADIDT